MFAVARSILGAQQADDIVQDTYLAARSRIDQLRDVSALDRWLARIAENLCYQALRRSSVQDRHHPRLADQPPASDPALRELIERLPLRERAIVVLHYAHGYSLEEVARHPVALLPEHPSAPQPHPTPHLPPVERGGPMS